MGKELKLEDDVLDSAGHNFGELAFNDPKKSMILIGQTDDSSPKYLLEVPLTGVAQVAIPNKNEVEIQYNRDTHEDPMADTLAMITFQVPLNSDQAEETDLWLGRIQERVEESGSVGDVVCEVDENYGNFLTPRGKVRNGFILF